MQQSNREYRTRRPGWWREENPGRIGNREISRLNRRTQKQLLRSEITGKRCPVSDSCLGEYCDFCQTNVVTVLTSCEITTEEIVVPTIHTADMVLLMNYQNGCLDFIRVDQTTWETAHDEIAEAVKDDLDCAYWDEDTVFPDHDGIYQLTASFKTWWNDDGRNLHISDAVFEGMELVSKPKGGQDADQTERQTTGEESAKSSG